MPRMRNKAKGRSRGGAFDPEDSDHVEHTKVGVWEVYQDKPEVLAQVPFAARLEPYYNMLHGLPFVWRMLKDIAKMRSCLVLLSLLGMTSVLLAFLPALSLWYSGQLITIAQYAIDERKVDRRELLTIAGGRLVCAAGLKLITIAENNIRPGLNNAIKQHFSIHMFRAVARLDVPTFNDNAVQDKLSQVAPIDSRATVFQEVIEHTMGTARIMMTLLAQCAVLMNVVRDQPDGPLIAAVACLPHFLKFVTSEFTQTTLNGAWIITTTNADYIKMQGLKQLINNGSHRQEIVVGGMWRHLFTEYRSLVMKLGDAAVQNVHYYLHRKASRSISSLLEAPLKELPQVVFTLRVADRPLSIPTSLASLNLITSTTKQFNNELFALFYGSSGMADSIARVKRVYEVENIPNHIEDGSVRYPENQADLRVGVAIEFRNVSFKYPDALDYALHNVSFSIKRGQLCVIVGKNGSGKSTILKLIARLYDPLDGTILVDGKDIKTLSLDDLRSAIAVLFQDYTHFPLSVGDNIGLGDPEHSDDLDRISEAARLGGADEVVAKLPGGFDTYLDRPVKDMYSAMPEGTKTLFGRPVDYSKLRRRGGMKTTESSTLSGGQMQRIALSRTFMRSLASDKAVGLLLFDEPSASLDPTAEHDLFERLRHLRGNKTMIFSSHRFGNLTRHADLILYMDDSVVVEEGTHAALLTKDGEYARIWKLQAQAFLS